jgi:hypothetical protein
MLCFDLRDSASNFDGDGGIGVIRLGVHSGWAGLLSTVRLFLSHLECLLLISLLEYCAVDGGVAGSAPNILQGRVVVRLGLPGWTTSTL